MSSTLIFDITQTAWTDTLNLFPIIPMVAGAVMIGINKSRKRQGLPAYTWSSRSDKPAPFLPYFFLGVGLFFTALIFKNSYFGYAKLRSEYEGGKCEVIEGKVENFHAGENIKGVPAESFDIKQKQFSYFDKSDRAAFHQTAANGGPIRENQQLRIAHCDGAIVRLEILDDDAAPPDDTGKQTQ
ncbi:MAG: hypothetical protein V4495_25880 [Pseudomonadota bacterium]